MDQHGIATQATATRVTATQARHERAGLVRTIITTGLLVGTLDAILAVLNFTLQTRSKHPERIPEYIASAVYGKEAFAGGAGFICIGLFFHYCIAFSFSILFLLLYPRLPILSRHRWVVAILYAVLVWSIMNLGVLPLTHARRSPFHLATAAIDAGILVFSVGLPVTFMASRYYVQRSTPLPHTQYPRPASPPAPEPPAGTSVY